jgi:lipopolysaccharide export LptBFGC system permease protein LptF
MVTLHAYLLRELLKTFGLSVLALTALFALGGGLYNVMRFPGVTAGDLFTVLPLLLPIVITLTMPVAALFATTMAYGRAAADNELVACRAAGVNIHRLFLSAILLSVFVALFTLVAVNLVIPEFLQRIEYFARGNVRDLAFHRLLQDGYIHYGRAGKEHYMLTAQQVKPVEREELVRKGFDPPGHGISYFWVEQPTFLMIDARGELKQFSVAEGGLCQFDTGGAQVNVTIYVINARYYEVGKRVLQIPEKMIGPYEAPVRFPVKPSMVDLETLQRWRAAPWEAPDLLAEIDRFRGRLRGYLFYLDAAEQLSDEGTLVLHDANGARYEITADSCVAGEQRLLLAGAKVAKHEPPRERPTRYVAAEARLTAAASAPGETLVELELSATPDQPVLEHNPRAVDYETAREKESLRLEGLLLPQRVLDQMERYSPAAVIDADVALPEDSALADAQGALRRSADKLRRKVGGLIHFRLGFASSALVTILMGAALGVIFRGSRALAAFGLACIPFGIVTILMLMGRQLTESSGTETIGPYVIWGGLALVGVTDGFILRFGVRR